MTSAYLCAAICVLIWIVNGRWLAHAIKERIASEIYMHIGLGILFTLLALELTIGMHGGWAHLDISPLEVIGWILYVPSAILVFGSMIALKHKGKPESADFTASTTLIDTGIYAHLRQPMTLGCSLWSIALILLFQSVPALVLGSVSLLCFSTSAVRESQYNIGKFGDAYREYMERVPMWNVLKELRKR